MEIEKDGIGKIRIWNLKILEVKKNMKKIKDMGEEVLECI